MDFDYIVRNVPGQGANLDEFTIDFEGCTCMDECTFNSCSCLRFGQNYDDEGRLLHAIGSTVPLLECHENCSCVTRETTCGNRVVQNGVKFQLEPFYLKNKGYGLRAGEFIKAGQFIIEYAGEIISRDEAIKRSENKSPNDHNYILTIVEHVAGKERLTHIDAKKKANLARFINHSCEPNLRPYVVRSDCIVPHFGLFAMRDIQSGEELTYDYGELSKEQLISQKGKPCLCGAANCRGILPASLF
uniref:Histone-lysine N-methyltransferase SETMAR n=1 Tax=Acrobeloides nanus TaxID=290746 RepID=A0A914E4Y7_9BILA